MIYIEREIFNRPDVLVGGALVGVLKRAKKNGEAVASSFQYLYCVIIEFPRISTARHFSSSLLVAVTFTFKLL